MFVAGQSLRGGFVNAIVGQIQKLANLSPRPHRKIVGPNPFLWKSSNLTKVALVAEQSGVYSSHRSTVRQVRDMDPRIEPDGALQILGIQANQPWAGGRERPIRNYIHEKEHLDS
jgi:hypothetical protein